MYHDISTLPFRPLLNGGWQGSVVRGKQEYEILKKVENTVIPGKMLLKGEERRRTKGWSALITKLLLQYSEIIALVICRSIRVFHKKKREELNFSLAVYLHWLLDRNCSTCSLKLPNVNAKFDFFQIYTQYDGNFIVCYGKKHQKSLLQSFSIKKQFRLTSWANLSRGSHVRNQLMVFIMCREFMENGAGEERKSEWVVG